MGSRQPSGIHAQQRPDGSGQPPSGPSQQPRPTSPRQAPGGPDQQPRRKRQRGLTITFGIAGGVIVLGIVAAVLGWGKSTSSTGIGAATGTGPAAQNAGSTAVAGIGEKVRDGQFEFVVTKVTHRKLVGGRQFGLGQTAQGTFTIISLKVTNIGSGRQDLHDSWQYVYDASGRKFGANPMADLALSGSNGQNNGWQGALSPGNTVHGKIAFDMPSGDKAVKIELHDSVFSDGAIVRLS
jgi:Domain of unknown function (DUF4352)